MIPALSPTHTADRQSAATVVAFPERPPGDSTLWREIVDGLDFALQPIVSIHTGLSLGFEVLLRNTDHAGYTSIQEFFDDAYADRMLYTVDLYLSRVFQSRESYRGEDCEGRFLSPLRIFFVSLTNSFRRSSVSGGMLTLIFCPDSCRICINHWRNHNRRWRNKRDFSHKLSNGNQDIYRKCYCKSKRGLE